MAGEANLTVYEQMDLADAEHRRKKELQEDMLVDTADRGLCIFPGKRAGQ